MKHVYTLTASMLAILLQSGVASASEDHSWTDSFLSTAFVETPELVDCDLADGSTGECYKMTVDYLPDDFEIGPFCPATTADEGGLWQWDGDDSGLYRIDGTFLKMLDDQGFKFYDADGTVHVVDIRTERPEDTNTCLSASVDEDVTMTLLIPANPKMADVPTDLGVIAKVGIAVDGVPIFADAPSVLDTGHLPALDVCGGHVDPGGWYHWHATASDIGTALETANVSADCALTQDASAMFGYAFDGFAIFGSQEMNGSTPTDLDACGGHMGGTIAEYHYHASDSFPNLPTCLKGVVAQDNFSTTAAGGVGSANGGAGGHNQPNLDEAAATLGVDPSQLMQALSDGGQRPDFAEVAKTLGVSEEDLRNALPAPPR